MAILLNLVKITLAKRCRHLQSPDKIDLNIHHMSMEIASTLYPAADTIVSLYTASPNRKRERERENTFIRQN